MSGNSGRVFTFSSVLITMTVVLVIAETRHLHSSSASSRHHDHPSRRGNWTLMNKTEHHQLQDHPNKHGDQSDQPEVMSSARSKRQTPEDDYEWDFKKSISDIANTSLCQYRTFDDFEKGRHPELIVQAECVNTSKSPCGYRDSDYHAVSSKSYFCIQAYEFIDTWYANVKSRKKILMGCICAFDEETSPSLHNLRRE